MTLMTEEDAVAELAAWVAGRRYGEVEVLRAIAEYRYYVDLGDLVWVTAVLADPPAGKETWPMDDILAMQAAVRRRAVDLGIETELHVSLLDATGAEAAAADRAMARGPSDDDT